MSSKNYFYRLFTCFLITISILFVILLILMILPKINYIIRQNILFINLNDQFEITANKFLYTAGLYP